MGHESCFILCWLEKLMFHLNLFLVILLRLNFLTPIALHRPSDWSDEVHYIFFNGVNSVILVFFQNVSVYFCKARLLIEAPIIISPLFPHFVSKLE